MPVRGSRSINMPRCSPASTASLPTAGKATRDVAGSDLAGERSRPSFERPTLFLGPIRFDRMSACGTFRTSRDVRRESAKRANADIDQIAVANCDSISTRPCGLHRPRGVLCQIVTGGQFPFGFLGQKYFGVTRIHREGTRPVHRPGGLPPPEGSALGGQNIPILNVSTYNSD